MHVCSYMDNCHVHSMHTIMITYNTLTHSALCAQHYMVLEGFMQSETNQRLKYVLEVVVVFPLSVCLSVNQSVSQSVCLCLCLCVPVCSIDM